MLQTNNFFHSSYTNKYSYNNRYQNNRCYKSNNNQYYNNKQCYNNNNNQFGRGYYTSGYKKSQCDQNESYYGNQSNCSQSMYRSSYNEVQSNNCDSSYCDNSSYYSPGYTESAGRTSVNSSPVPSSPISDSSSVQDVFKKNLRSMALSLAFYVTSSNKDYLHVSEQLKQLDENGILELCEKEKMDELKLDNSMALTAEIEFILKKSYPNLSDDAVLTYVQMIFSFQFKADPAYNYHNLLTQEEIVAIIMYHNFSQWSKWLTKKEYVQTFPFLSNLWIQAFSKILFDQNENIKFDDFSIDLSNLKEQVKWPEQINTDCNPIVWKYSKVYMKPDLKAKLPEMMGINNSIINSILSPLFDFSKFNKKSYRSAMEESCYRGITKSWATGKRKIVSFDSEKGVTVWTTILNNLELTIIMEYENDRDLHKITNIKCSKNYNPNEKSKYQFSTLTPSNLQLSYAPDFEKNKNAEHFQNFQCHQQKEYFLNTLNQDLKSGGNLKFIPYYFVDLKKGGYIKKSPEVILCWNNTYFVWTKHRKGQIVIDRMVNLDCNKRNHSILNVFRAAAPCLFHL